MTEFFKVLHDAISGLLALVDESEVVSQWWEMANNQRRANAAWQELVDA